MPSKKMTTEKFKEKVFNKYKNKVDILTEYIGATEPITFIYHCEKHGDTKNTINAKNILAKSFQPCKKCNSEIHSNKRKDLKNNNECYYNKFKNQVESKGGKLISKQWIKSKTLYDIECKEGHIFSNSADKIMNSNQWCPYCCGRKGDFEKDINDIIKSKNGTMLSKYINANTHIRVRCEIHNYEWDIMPLNINKGRWCPICHMKYSEKVVYDYLKANNFNFLIQYTFDNLISDKGEPLRYDFAILNNKNELNYLFEVDGNSHEYDESTKNSDKIKNDYCKINKIKLFRMIYFNSKKNFQDYDYYYKYINAYFKSNKLI